MNLSAGIAAREHFLTGTVCTEDRSLEQREDRAWKETLSFRSWSPAHQRVTQSVTAEAFGGREETGRKGELKSWWLSNSQTNWQSALSCQTILGTWRRQLGETPYIDFSCRTVLFEMEPFISAFSPQKTVTDRESCIISHRPRLWWGTSRPRWKTSLTSHTKWYCCKMYLWYIIQHDFFSLLPKK